MRYFVFFLLLFSSFTLAAEPEFAESHDPALYGKTLSVRKIENSQGTSDLAVHGNRLFAIGRGHLTVYDLTDPKNPHETATMFGMEEPRQLVWFKDNLFITARMGGLYVVDVSEPDLPRLRSHYDTMELATGIVCGTDPASGRNLAFVCQRQFGTEIIDISDPSHLKNVSFVVSGEAQSVDLENGVLYAGDWGTRKLTIIDVRNPEHAEIISESPIAGLGDGVYVRGNIAYAATGPDHIERFLYDVKGHGLDVFSVENPRKPVHLGRIDLPIQAQHVFPDFWTGTVDEHGMAYVADTYNGVFCIDVKDPTRPQCVANAVLPKTSNGRPDPAVEVVAGEGILYAAGMNGGIYIVEAPGIARPVSKERKAPTLDGPVLPTLDPLADVRAGFAVLPTQGQCMAAAPWKDGLVWVAAGTDGFLLVDVSAVSGGGKPVVKKTFPIRSFAYDVKIAGNLMFTAEGEAGTGIYELKPNGEPKRVGRFDQLQPVRQVVIQDPKKWLISKSGNHAVTFLDISDPARPRNAFTFRNPFGILYGRDVVETPSPSGMVALIAMTNGIVWFDCTGETPCVKTTSYDPRVWFNHGACLHRGQWYFFADRGFRLMEECDARKLDDVSLHVCKDAAGKPLSAFGKCVSNGKEIVFTNRREGEIAFIDVNDPEEPKITRRFTVHAHPEIPVFVNGKAIIPCGHAGLIVEK